jgi:hypothetical protein
MSMHGPHGLASVRWCLNWRRMCTSRSVPRCGLPAMRVLCSEGGTRAHAGLKVSIYRLGGFEPIWLAWVRSKAPSDNKAIVQCGLPQRPPPQHRPLELQTGRACAALGARGRCCARSWWSACHRTKCLRPPRHSRAAPMPVNQSVSQTINNRPINN